MTSQQALQLVEAMLLLESKTAKQLTATEKEIIKAAWDNETYTNVAESLYLSVGYIKDLAAALWQRLSSTFGQKVTKSNFRRVMEQSDNLASYYAKNRANRSDNKATNSILGNSSDRIDLSELPSKATHHVGSTNDAQTVFKTIHDRKALPLWGDRPPDIIVLALNLPDLDKEQVCQSLKADRETSPIPIIILNSLDEVTEKVKALKFPRIDRIAKPSAPEELINRIQNKLTIQQEKNHLRKQIEQHQQAAEAFYQSRTLLANLLNTSKDGIAAIEAVRDPATREIESFRTLIVNPIFAQLLAQNREDIADNILDRQAIAKLNPTLFDSLVKVVDKGVEVEQEFYWESNDRQVWYRLNAVRFADGCSITIREIASFKLIELQMKTGEHLQQMATEAS